MLTFSNLEKSADGYFSGMEGHAFKINSKVVTVSVSNRNTSHLDQPVKLTFDHLLQVTNIFAHFIFFLGKDFPNTVTKKIKVERFELNISQWKSVMFSKEVLIRVCRLSVTDQYVFSREK